MMGYIQDQALPKKPSLWCVLGDRPKIEPDKGDSIGEYRLLKQLSNFFDVFYNGDKVDFENAVVGNSNNVTVPNEKYDLYYVRSNPEIFKMLPHPKIYMAYPYEYHAFKCADALVVTTASWQRLLRSCKATRVSDAFYQKWYPDDAFIPKNIIQIPQSCDEGISKINVSEKTSQEFYFKMTSAQALGFYGRLDVDSLPHSVIRCFQAAPLANHVLTFAGSMRAKLRKAGGLPRQSVYLDSVDYKQMPSLLAATAYSLADESVDAQYLGSNKVLDSINVGVPVLAKRNAVREQYLGEFYPGLFQNDGDLLRKLESLAHGSVFKDELEKATCEAARCNQPNQAAEKLKTELMAVFPELLTV